MRLACCAVVPACALNHWLPLLCRCIRLTGFTIPLVRGRGIFQYSYGLLPRRHELHTVMGPAIPVEKVRARIGHDWTGRGHLMLAAATPARSLRHPDPTRRGSWLHCRSPTRRPRKWTPCMPGTLPRCRPCTTSTRTSTRTPPRLTGSRCSRRHSSWWHDAGLASVLCSNSKLPREFVIAQIGLRIQSNGWHEQECSRHVNSFRLLWQQLQLQ